MLSGRSWSSGPATLPSRARGVFSRHLHRTTRAFQPTYPLPPPHTCILCSSIVVFILFPFIVLFLAMALPLLKETPHYPVSTQLLNQRGSTRIRKRLIFSMFLAARSTRALKTSCSNSAVLLFAPNTLLQPSIIFLNTPLPLVLPPNHLFSFQGGKGLT